MGGSGSKSITDITAQAIINVAINASNSTSQAVIGGININNSTINANITGSTTAVQNAIANMQITNDMLNKILTDMKQQAQAESSAMAVAVTENESKIRTLLSTTLTTNFVNTASQVVNNQINISGSVINKDVSSVVKVAQKTIADMLNENKAWNTTANTIDQQSGSSSKLLDIFGGSGMTWILIIVGLLALVFIYFRFIKQKSGAGYPTELDDWHDYYL